MAVRETQRERLTPQLTTAMRVHEPIRTPSTLLTHGKTLGHCKVVNAYDPTMAPIMKGKGVFPFFRSGF
jgi:hypothetical protein